MTKSMIAGALGAISLSMAATAGFPGAGRGYHMITSRSPISCGTRK